MMEMLLVLAALLGLVVIVLIIKRKSASHKAEKNISAEHGKLQAVAPKPASKRVDTASRQTQAPAVDKMEPVEKVGESAEMERQTPATVPFSPLTETPEKIPEDSALRRHYLSSRQAEKEALAHPYPTDSTLRRHYQSMLTTTLKGSAVAAKVENPVQPLKKPAIPEDSTLRRHFLTQLQTEIESRLFPRPTDSALRRHYDAQVKARMEEYLTRDAA